MTRQWTSNDVMEIARAFQGSCVLVAAAELGLFDILVRKPLTARELAEGLSADVRATTRFFSTFVTP